LGTEDDGTQGKSKKTKSRKEMFKEDLDVGHFYLDKKNWKAAQERFGAAFALDKEAPEAVWGLAEAERHLEMFDKAREHYELFLSYDPDGPHSRAARKALEQVESIRPAAATPTAGAALPSIAQQPQ
jgi:tetratricopeptide (TPR) repeat protein